MSERLRATVPSREPLMFPTLTPDQLAHVERLGRRRALRAGETLVEVGDPKVPFLVVLQGQIEIIRLFNGQEVVVAAHGPGQFTGEVGVLSGRPALFRARSGAAGEAIELDRDRLLAIVQTDTDLSDIFMRAFILRRLELIAHGMGDVVLIGSNHCAGTIQAKEFLTRNGHPYSFVDLDREVDVQALLDHFHITEGDIPVLICRGETVLRRPTNRQIADCLGFNDSIDPADIRDVVIVGAGPSGLAAAVYGASEGLNVLMLESMAPGGQAAWSSRIENYLGFPTGVSGQDLAARAYTQAQKFGAQLVVAKGARRLACDRRPYALEMEDGSRVPARAVIIATGAEYRKLSLPDLIRFEGVGLYYSATFLESQLCRGADVIVVGGGNSAGQAAVYLAQTARRVYMLVRGSGLAETMSRYLIRRIEALPSIELRTHTTLAAAEGDQHLERVTWRDDRTGEVETRDVRHVFVMTGATPSTGWLDGCLVLDDKGFIKTGPDLSTEDLAGANWPLARPPHLLETSLPGVFAVGDVRGGNLKRVASAVGEGAIAIAFVHRVLQE